MFTASAVGFLSVREKKGATASIVRGNDWTIDLAGSNTQNWTDTAALRLYSGQIRILAGSAGTVTGAASFYVDAAAVSGATLTNQYGLYVEDLTGATNNYSVYTYCTTKY